MLRFHIKWTRKTDLKFRQNFIFIKSLKSLEPKANGGFMKTNKWLFIVQLFYVFKHIFLKFSTYM